MHARRAPGDLRRRGSQRRSRSGRPPAPAGKAKGRCVVIGAGKASVAMAALDAAWRDVDLTGVVVTRYGQGAPAGRIAVIAAPPLALSAAADAAAKAGLTSLILGNAIEGESRQVGIVMAEIARPVRLNGGPVQAPAILP